MERKINVYNMKRYVLLIIISTLNCICWAQSETKDSVFIQINKVPSNKILFGINEGKLVTVSVDTKTKYKYFSGFISAYSNSELILYKKTDLPSKKIISYKSYNGMLNKNFMDIYLHYHTYFIISEDKNNYLLLQVRPIVVYKQ